ncbi:polyphenol oxidase family protein [Hydrogenothermus marinus]|uniref:Purine nucleoside phosphorylase n=1 Tax=Hydrogenothermus marinus TaxID=133270 RepID=A0A3M0BA70_9AQUI|nr:polyphenol oxidase family protein [Hydrogenothermus marinus]RMA93059.1 hypothetical protein CLV39_1539 [Hydrogenothermus marinus]
MKHLQFKNLNIIYREKEDNPEEVLKNLPVKDVIFPKQTHSNIVCSINDNNLNISCDGIWTDKKNMAIGVKTADCVPVVLSDFKKIAVIHAGWRGIVSGIVENAINLFDNKIEIAYIAPHAKVCCYEVKEDFFKKIGKDYFKYIKKNRNKIYFDMELAIKDKLTVKAKQIIDSGKCTICSENLFSYRKGDIKERMLTIAFLD